MINQYERELYPNMEELHLVEASLKDLLGKLKDGDRLILSVTQGLQTMLNILMGLGCLFDCGKCDECNLEFLS